MKNKLRERVNVDKAAHFAIIINALQIAAIIAVFTFVLLNPMTSLSRNTELTLIAFSALIIIWGAAVDIHEAVTARKISEQTQMIEESYAQLEVLNGTLRSQRHDFMNHLQVVFSLTELQEYDEAMQYIERVYGDIQRVSSVLKTSLPAVNALIAAKNTDCTECGIRFETEIASSWSGLPVSGWEMCRVFGNLIDNARDAIVESGCCEDRYIRLMLGETPGAFTFAISNNGPQIAKNHIRSIFQLGFTTKSEGHGSGLSIVTEILESYGGQISVDSTLECTCFSGTIPKPAISSKPLAQE